MVRATVPVIQSPTDEAAQLVADARRRGDAVAIVSASGARVIVITPGAPATSGDDLLPLGEAARVAATTKRRLARAIRDADLAAVGGQRDRAVRRADLDRWIESRAVRTHPPIEDADIERRMRRIDAARRRE